MKKGFSTSPLLFCLVFLFGSQAAHAQYRFDHWSADNGLPQNSVRDIVQTRDGYLWLTTFDGLVRFDGVRFTVFNKSNSPGILTNRFVSLYEDGQGDLWASTETAGLTRLHQGRFTTYTTKDGLPDNYYINGLGGDGQGHLLLFSGLHLFRWMDDKFQPADDLRQPVSGATGERVHLPFMSDSINGMACFVNGELRSWTSAELPPSLIFFPAMPPVQDREGNIWFGSDDGLVKIENRRTVKDYTMKNGLPGKQTRLVYGQRPLQVLSVRDDGSLWLTDVDSMQSHLVAQQPPEGLIIQISYADREGNIWFGTLRDGLYRARKQSVTAYSKAQGLMATEVYPVFEDRTGTIWVGAASEGLFRLKDGAFTNYRSSASAYVTSIYEDRAGQLWISGAWRFEDGRFVRGISKDVLPDTLNFIWTMYEDREGAFWFGAVHGVVRYQNGAATHYTTQDGLAGDDTKVIIGDAAGGLWLGSYGGLTHYKDGRFTSWAEGDGLPGNTVRALKQDDDGTLWIGTYDSGLGRFKDGRFTRYKTNDGLYDNGVFQILEDAAGWCWMSCNRGIYRVRKQELNDFADGKIKAITSIGYGKGDGMVNAECNGGRWPAGVKARDGKLWFPTMGGVAVIDPATVTTNAQPPPVVIEGVRVDNKDVAFDTWEATLRNPQRAIRIAPGQENFEIQYTALSFINSENLRFRYKLEALDHDWVEAGTRRTAYYSHVPPGAYTFRVIAANSDGVWNEEGKSVSFRVLPPFYQTWWFLTLVTLSLGGMALLTYRRRFAALQARHAAQEAFSRRLIESQEAERKRIAAELHDSLSQNLVIIKNRALIGLQTPGDQARTTGQLEDIVEAATSTLDEVKEIAYALRPFHLDRLGLAQAIEVMLERVTETSGLRFTTDFDPLDGMFSPEVEINLYRMVQECVNNIVKHAQATEGKVTIKKDDGWRGARAVIVIADNGRGFTPKAGNNANYADNQANRGERLRRGGFGLSGLAERARIIDGQVTVDSAPGRGTTITIRIYGFLDKDTETESS
jgi:signal transduction histidine kinase/ligand-binding sensor domain-containing protein